MSMADLLRHLRDHHHLLHFADALAVVEGESTEEATWIEILQEAIDRLLETPLGQE